MGRDRLVDEIARLAFSARAIALEVAVTAAIGVLTGLVWWITCSTGGGLAVVVFAVIGLVAYTARARWCRRGRTWARR